MAEPQQAQGLSGIQAMLDQMNAYKATLEQEQAAQQQAEAQQAQEQQQVSSTFGAIVEAATLVGAADGKLSESESRRIADRVCQLADGRLSSDQIHALVQEAASRIQAEGAAARADAVAGALEDSELRRAALLVASAVGWMEGGVGQKEGLALQSLARAFGVPINELHQLMGQAHG